MLKIGFKVQQIDNNWIVKYKFYGQITIFKVQCSLAVNFQILFPVDILKLSIFEFLQAVYWRKCSLDQKINSYFKDRRVYCSETAFLQ